MLIYLEIKKHVTENVLHKHNQCVEVMEIPIHLDAFLSKQLVWYVHKN